MNKVTLNKYSVKTSYFCNSLSRYFLISCANILLMSPFVNLQAGELSGNISVEGRYFPSNPAYPNQQKSGGLALSFQPEYKHSWDNDHKKFTFTPFYRWDSEDKERTHADIRQLDFSASKGDWEFQVGVSKVFWGVAESQHLVDIINQSDTVENIDGESKLGQPLVRLSRLTDNGALDLFVLPYFRERTFPGVAGRFRSGLVVDTNAVTYEDTNKKENHVDYALRITETIDEFDLGFHVFDGTSRDPILTPILSGGVPVGLAPYYPLITQLGLDLQYTGESTTYKLEAINRDFKTNTATLRDYTALVAGFEHTLPAFESGSELGLLAEYHHDSRGLVLNAPFQNDLFVGARYAKNDENSSELLAGAFVDLDNHSKSFGFEASRRLGKGFKLNLEGQVFTDIDIADPTKIFEKDDYLKVEVQKFF